MLGQFYYKMFIAEIKFIIFIALSSSLTTPANFTIIVVTGVLWPIMITMRMTCHHFDSIFLNLKRKDKYHKVSVLLICLQNKLVLNEKRASNNIISEVDEDDVCSNNQLCTQVVVRKFSSYPLCLQDNLGAVDYLCIVAKVALLVQKEDNYYMLRLRDTNNLST